MKKTHEKNPVRDAVQASASMLRSDVQWLLGLVKSMEDAPNAGWPHAGSLQHARELVMQAVRHLRGEG